MIVEVPFDGRRGGVRCASIGAGVEEALERNGLWLERVEVPEEYQVFEGRVTFFICPPGQLMSGQRTQNDAESARFSGSALDQEYLLPDGSKIVYYEYHGGGYHSKEIVLRAE